VLCPAAAAAAAHAVEMGRGVLTCDRALMMVCHRTILQARGLVIRTGFVCNSEALTCSTGTGVRKHTSARVRNDLISTIIQLSNNQECFDVVHWAQGRESLCVTRGSFLLRAPGPVICRNLRESRFYEAKLIFSLKQLLEQLSV
jgi:hypothetical protein